MSSLEQIEAAILTLPLEEFQRLRQWFFEEAGRTYRLEKTSPARN